MKNTLTVNQLIDELELFRDREGGDTPVVMTSDYDEALSIKYTKPARVAESARSDSGYMIIADDQDEVHAETTMVIALKS